MAADDNRYIPAPVRRALRAEVGFGCPAEECRSPYLSYHHFDPPWVAGHEHNPEGMIALCLDHHKRADKGTYTNEQLRLWKRTGATVDVRGTFDWKRETTLFLAGGTYFQDCPTILRASGQNIIWLSRDERNFDQFNIDLYSNAGELVLRMRDNDWEVIPSLDDIEALPSGHLLSVRAKQEGIRLDIEFGTTDAGAITRDLVNRGMKEWMVRGSVVPLI